MIFIQSLKSYKIHVKESPDIISLTIYDITEAVGYKISRSKVPGQALKLIPNHNPGANSEGFVSFLNLLSIFREVVGLGHWNFAQQ